MATPIEPVPIHFNPANRQVSPELQPYKHIELLANPLERYRGIRDFHYQRLLVRGNEHGFRVTQHDTVPTLEESKDLIGQLGRTSIVAIVGGDGTASMAMRAAYELGFDNPFMILNGGNAINQGRMHHYDWLLYKPERILRHGRIRQVHPILDRAEYPDGTVVDTVAFAYDTRGFTARATAKVTEPEHRQAVEGMPERKKMVEEVRVALTASKEAAPFIMREDGKPDRLLSELAFVSGKLMAKYLRFPSDLFERECVVVEAEDVRYRTIGKTALSLALPFARRRHEWLGEHQERRFQLFSLDGSDIDFEHDGEARHDPSDTIYTVGISARWINVVASRGS